VGANATKMWEAYALNARAAEERDRATRSSASAAQFKIKREEVRAGGAVS
jgi:hypothetical protein